MNKNTHGEPWKVVGCDIAQATGEHIAEFFEPTLTEYSGPYQIDHTVACVNALKDLRPEKLAAFIEAVRRTAEIDCDDTCVGCDETENCDVHDLRIAYDELRIADEEEA